MTSEPRRLLVDHGGEKGIGDVVCELNVYPVLKAQHPDAVLVSRGSRTLAWGNPLVDAFDESSPDEAFDAILRFNPSAHRLKDSLAQRRTIFAHFLDTQDLLPHAEVPRLYPLPQEVADLGLTPDHPDDLIIAYSVDSKEPDRRWGEERFAELIASLKETYGGTYLELGSGFTAGHVGIGYDLVGQTDLRQTMALLSASDLFIGNHGGLTHLAGGVGTPILAPWGASTPYEAYAYDDLSVAVETMPDCRNCGWTGEVLPGCREASILTGRTPCTQEITVERMREAAAPLFAHLLQHRDALRRERETRRLAARDPHHLERFERPLGLNAYANLRIYLGGEPGWGAHHRTDDYARLRQIVAFPDWHNPLSAWDSLVSTYVSCFEGDDPWVLTLSVAPLTGPDVQEILTEYLLLLERRGAFPKIMLILGSLAESERRALIRQADAYVSLEGPYHLEGVDGARYVSRIEEVASLRERERHAR